ncbi:hypothetical protein AB0K62_13525 [Streptomyces halstedii]|uniref:hypothetical protein n=1 Tax=Streptomyces halstedii TaxID=1944 RepID=UPI003460FB50
MTDTPMTPAAALTRLRQYGERTSTWSIATYNDGTEKALHEIALTLAAEVNRLSDDMTGACLARYEEEQDADRLRLALASAQRGRRELRARVTELEANPALEYVLELVKTSLGDDAAEQLLDYNPDLANALAAAQERTR